jgi:hypothetical protein
MIAQAMLTLRKRYGEDNADDDDDGDHPQTFWSWLIDAGRQIMSMRLMRPKEDFLQGRTLMPHRYVLHHAYTVPFDDVDAGPQIFGPSCSFVIANEEQSQQPQPRLAVITSWGGVKVLNMSNMQLDLDCLTRKSISLVGGGYGWILDKLWYCSNNNKGLLILQHRQHPLQKEPVVRVLDLARTDQDIGREAEFEESAIDGARGIDQRIVTASEAFNEEWFSDVAVSSKHGLVFFVGNDTNSGQICIESYRVKSDGEELVASIRHRVNTSLPTNTCCRHARQAGRDVFL